MRAGQINSLPAREVATTSTLSLETATGRDALQEARRLLAAGSTELARRWATTVVDLTDNLAVWSGAAAVLSRCLADVPLPRRAKVAILGSSTTSQLAALLPLACARGGLQVEVYEAPFGLYRQEVLDPASRLHSFDPDFVVLAMHEGDVDLPALTDDPSGAVSGALEQLEGLWQALNRTTRATVLQYNFALPPEQPLGHLGTSVPGSRHRMLLELNLRMALAAPPSVYLVDCAKLAADVGARTWFDPRYWFMAKQAVNPTSVPVLARHTSAVVAAAAGLSRKCLVLDLDGTVWGGVLGEAGFDGLQLGYGPQGEAFSAFQTYALDLKSKGIVLAVCSKNDEGLVREAFASVPGMRLKLDDIAVLSAGWDDKPAQLRRLAADLGLGLDALVLADDNPVEREAVRQLLPEVDVLQLPEDPAGYARVLADYPWFETVRLTDEDTARTDQYRARASAASALGAATSLDDFLDSLDMEGAVEPVSERNLDRVAQLVGKTNQFNLTSRRRSAVELAQFVARDDVVALAVRLRDRFADHGLIGVVLARVDGARLDIDTWLMSCRVIGRTLEHALIAMLDEHARALGCRSLCGTYAPTAKNGLVADLYPRLGFTPDGEEPKGVTSWRRDVGLQTIPATHVRLTAHQEGATCSTRG